MKTNAYKNVSDEGIKYPVEVSGISTTRVVMYQIPLPPTWIINSGLRKQLKKKPTWFFLKRNKILFFF